MAKASVTGQITIVSNGTTFYTVIQCQLGDLYQTYLGDESAVTNISPDFEASGATKPMLVFLAYSAELGSGNGLKEVANTNMHWYIGTTELTFDAQGLSTNTFGGTTGHFTKTTQQIATSTDGSTYTTVPALQVNKNIVKVNNLSSFLIRGEADVSVTNSSVRLSASYQVSVTKATENTKHVTIIAGDTKYFTISDKGGYCLLKAQVDNKDAANLGYVFKWYLPDDTGAWAQQSETSDVFSVLETKVQTSTLVKLEVYKDDTLYGMDVQTVNDVTDPYHISPNPVDDSGKAMAEQFTKGDGSHINYKPILWYNNNGSVAKVSDATFKMWLYDTAGVSILSYETAATSFQVEESKVSSRGGVVYIIQTAD